MFLIKLLMFYTLKSNAVILLTLGLPSGSRLSVIGSLWRTLWRVCFNFGSRSGSRNSSFDWRYGELSGSFRLSSSSRVSVRL